MDVGSDSPSYSAKTGPLGRSCSTAFEGLNRGRRGGGAATTLDSSRRTDDVSEVALMSNGCHPLTRSPHEECTHECGGQSNEPPNRMHQIQRDENRQYKQARDP